MERELVRRFLKKMQWANISALCYLQFGQRPKSVRMRVIADLEQMTRVKMNPLRRLTRHRETIYASNGTSKRFNPGQQFDSQCCMREIIARLSYDGCDLDSVILRSPTRAVVGKTDIELDDCKTDPAKFFNYILKRYSKRGHFQVLIISSVGRYCAYGEKWAEERIQNEFTRSGKLMKLFEPYFIRKPNLFLFASHTDLLETGRCLNLKLAERKPVSPVS